MNNADLRQHDEQIDEFFAKDDEHIDVSEIQNMINKSGPSPLADMEFQDEEDIDFYNNLKRVVDDDMGDEENEGYQMDEYGDIFDD
jgi:hypothetical protein